ncbi:hypothetical protein [Nannocystis pusilla]|uniref:PRC-barrel domain-containing protein n=1 Tax=Nannocystis pusilla TaxID=889268 RepID=A0ABS7TPN3_9BACT|nr:hypothetical protein [Nannocystis pusilla]MBZ5710188.1 hypothetical protein [Nannocystis pusilla]
MRFAGRSSAVAVIVSSLTWSTPSQAQPSQQFAEPPVTTPAPPQAGEPAPAAITDSTWNAVKGADVALYTSQGVARGTLVGFDDTTVTLLLQGGVLKTLAREDIRDVRVEDARTVAAANRSLRPPDHTNGEHRGTGRIISGKVITSVGGVLMGLGLVTGIAILGAQTADLVPVTASLMMWGAVHLAVGIPLLVSGKRARKQYDLRMMEERGRYGRLRLAPVAAPVRGGAVAGLSLSF